MWKNQVNHELYLVFSTSNQNNMNNSYPLYILYINSCSHRRIVQYKTAYYSFYLPVSSFPYSTWRKHCVWSGWTFSSFLVALHYPFLLLTDCMKYHSGDPCSNIILTNACDRVDWMCAIFIMIAGRLCTSYVRWRSWESYCG